MKSRMGWLCVVGFCAFYLVACGGRDALVSGCSSADGLEPLCLFRKPEDLALLPDGHTLVVSQMGDVDGHEPGSIVLFDTDQGAITRLPLLTGEQSSSWGGRSCPGSPGESFAPHGIDLSQRPDGALQLLVVNHGKRESVEFFELSDDTGDWRVEWRGCVLAPPGSFLNDVVALPDGGFLTTHMFPKSNPRFGAAGLEVLKGVLGMDVGSVLHWDGTRFSELKGSRSPSPNGIALSPAGDRVFINVYLGNEVRALSFPEGELLGVAQVRHPDNSTWDRNGHLLVASQTGSLLELMRCVDANLSTGACATGFEIVSIDPQSMTPHTVLSHEGAPMGAASVAIRVDTALYIGSFAGDRLLRVALPLP